MPSTIRQVHVCCGVKPGVDLGTRLCFGTIAQTICDYLGVDASTLDGQSVLSDILK